MSLDFFSAFIIGLLGSGHCVVMCGGISTMLTTAISDASQQKKYVIIFAYNFGRIASYSVIGALVAFTSSMATKEIGLPVSLLKTIAGIFLILLGLYLGQWLMWLSHVEHLGKNLWRHISPKTKKFIPIKNINSAFALGALWGWLPCGLVYSTLTWALASADAINGALIMFFFGLGTLPALLSVSLGTISIKSLLSNALFRKLAAISVIFYGFYTILIAYL
ncbi:sulfite exporter TauE/SafE family protein [Colwellia sp. M166]|uniref:sulfite exporter TauE/SafE family protein n=1 Tax=Colwellia sp. M166 TaxID=2583805 RepID=UPI00211EB704|nr:sulfite exporter TauE/SafE family protein [Colwellia sp. M166]UUO25087.1 sulfite exporter TauE/SafE family protein [Colwellia sp. M166]|tara:strand:- start:2168 stop:2830 length:663 start_codon:yes stop_codon:yes gene_type:complete